MAKAASALSKAFAARLKKSNKDWKGAKEKAKEQKGFAEFEDGRYIARLVNVKVGESGAGRLQAVFAFKIEDDESNDVSVIGREKLDFMGLESEQNLEFFARRLTQLGYEMPDDLSEIGDIFDDINSTKPLCKIRVKTKGEFQNVYLDKVFGDDEETADEDDGDDEGAPASEEEETDDTESEEESEEEEAEEEPAPVKKGKKKAAPVVEEEEESEEEEEEEESAEDEEDEGVELTVGATVVAETSKGEREGEVIEIIEAEGKARVKMSDDGKVLRIAIDKLSISEEVPEEPKVAPKKKTKK